MGHQIRFFLSQKDALELEKELISMECAGILHSRSRGPFPQSVESVDLVEDGRRWLFFCFARKADIDFIVNEHIPTQGYWSINTLKSPVVEFMHSPCDAGVLRNGRLYYEEYYYDSSQAVMMRKSPDFVEWAQRLFARTRRFLTHDKDLGAYMGKEAIEMRKAGIELR
jgi:hypothetical protein